MSLIGEKIKCYEAYDFKTSCEWRDDWMKTIIPWWDTWIRGARLVACCPAREDAQFEWKREKWVDK